MPAAAHLFLDDAASENFQVVGHRREAGAVEAVVDAMALAKA